MNALMEHFGKKIDNRTEAGLIFKFMQQAGTSDILLSGRIDLRTISR